jgi:hypothetical protein
MSYAYGLTVVGSSSSTIQLVAPLTKKQVSIDNGGGGNWGADTNNGADINQIKIINEAELAVQEAALAAKASRIDAASQNIKATGTVNVPEDCDLYEAVEAVELINMRKYVTDGRSVMFVLGKGEHQVDGDELEISSAMNIVGNPGVAKEEIVVVGGICFMEGIQENCHLQHLTLRQAQRNGVTGYSSFTMEDVLVEQCGRHGVIASGTGVTGKCTNMEVRQCGGSGVCAFNCASITLIGDKTAVHHNCTDGDSDDYGLEVNGFASSTIQLIYPLTKEQVSVDNGGGGNWTAEYDADTFVSIRSKRFLR